jgi:uncharacterized damage-inducible protein DinB
MAFMSIQRIVFSVLIAAAMACAQPKQAAPKKENAKQEWGTGWMGEFNYTADEVVRLAEAVPASKYGWRPQDGVRSISEVYVHIAVAHLFFLNSAGVKVDMSKVTRDIEKKMVAKDEVVKFLKDSIALVKENYPKLDLQKKVHFVDADTNIDGIMIHLLAHTNEHLGQSIAYARMNGIVPPWSE